MTQFIKITAFFLLTLALVITAAGCGKEEKAEEVPSGLQYEYNEELGGVVITGYTGTAADVEIPSKIEKRPVIAIGDRAFKDCTALTSIIIPDSMTSIGDLAFEGCANLTSINIPDSVKGLDSMGSYVFVGCDSLTNATYKGAAYSTAGVVNTDLPEEFYHAVWYATH